MVGPSNSPFRSSYSGEDLEDDILTSERTVLVLFSYCIQSALLCFSPTTTKANSSEDEDNNKHKRKAKIVLVVCG